MGAQKSRYEQLSLSGSTKNHGEHTLDQDGARTMILARTAFSLAVITDRTLCNHKLVTASVFNHKLCPSHSKGRRLRPQQQQCPPVTQVHFTDLKKLLFTDMADTGDNTRAL